MNEATGTGKLRLIVDANVFISYLIKLDEHGSTINRAVRMAIGGDFDLIVPPTLMVELRRAPFRRKLAHQISVELVEGFLERALALAGRIVSPRSLTIELPERDAKDRYLIEAAIDNDADILVSGDKHLLSLRGVLDRPRVMSPADFVAEFGDPAL
jgi:uncharacterized protein